MAASLFMLARVIVLARFAQLLEASQLVRRPRPFFDMRLPSHGHGMPYCLRLANCLRALHLLKKRGRHLRSPSSEGNAMLLRV